MEKKKSESTINRVKNCAVIVAHPDDETLWAGGIILANPQIDWTILTLCRKSDSDRSKRFFRALECLGASGRMADLDDGPRQKPLKPEKLRKTITNLLGTNRSFDLVITHGTKGEYTKHIRHEETARAVLTLWTEGKINARQLWLFAYEDNQAKYLPKAIKTADKIIRLQKKIWLKKYGIITKIYGFSPQSFEAAATPKKEAFWVLRTPKQLKKVLNERR